MTPARIAIVGAGGISRNHVAAIATTNGRAKVTAVVEPREASRDALVASQPGARGFASLDAFYAADAKSIADAVMLCTPPNVRVDAARRAIDAGLAVFSEKPLAHTLAEAQALARLAHGRPDVPTVVGYCHRFVPAIVEIRRRLDAGELGEVIRFENAFASTMPGMRDHWMSDSSVSGGGSFLDTGCHSLDLFRHLIGDASMTAAIFHQGWPGRGESAATAMLRATSTARHRTCVGIVQSGWAEPGRFELRLTGTRGALYYNYEQPTELRWTPVEGPATTFAIETHEVRFDRQLLAFAGLIAGETPLVLAATFDDGLATAKLVDEAHRIRQII